MSYTVTVDQENLPPGVEVYIHGLGTFKNGESAEVDDAQAERFRAANSTVDHETDENGRMSHKPSRGPALEDAVSSMYGVTVEKDGQTYGAKAEKSDSSDNLDPETQAQMEADLAEQNGGASS